MHKNMKYPKCSSPKEKEKRKSHSSTDFIFQITPSPFLHIIINTSWYIIFNVSMVTTNHLKMFSKSPSPEKNVTTFLFCKLVEISCIFLHEDIKICINQDDYGPWKMWNYSKNTTDYTICISLSIKKLSNTVWAWSKNIKNILCRM